MTTQSEVCWSTFADFQRDGEPLSIERALGREEALTNVLEELINDPSTSDHNLRRRFASLSRNRSSKYYHRRDLERNQARPSYRRGGRGFDSSSTAPIGSDLSEEIAQAELVMLVRDLLPEHDFLLLWEIAEGRTYSDVACDQEVSVASIKARVFRIRARIRMSPIGQELRRVLVLQVR